MGTTTKTWTFSADLEGLEEVGLNGDLGFFRDSADSAIKFSMNNNWSYLGTCGSGTNNTSQATLSGIVTNAANSGEVLVAWCSTDNAASADGQTNEHTSLIDTRGNTYIKIREHCKSGGAANGGSTASLWASKLTKSLAINDNLTLGLSTAKVAKAIGFDRFNGPFFTPSGYNGAVGTGTTSPSGLSTTIPLAPYLWLGMVGIEGVNTGTYTQYPSFSNPNNIRIGTTGGTAAANQSARFGYRIATNTSQAYSPTLGTAVDCAILISALSYATGLYSEIARKSTTGETWESWGVPAGAIVQTAQITSWKDKTIAASGINTHTLQARLISSSGTIIHGSGDLLNSSLTTSIDGSYVAGTTGTLVPISSSYQASNTDVRLELQYNVISISGAITNIDQRFDDFTLFIFYNLTQTGTAGFNTTLQLAQVGNIKINSSNSLINYETIGQIGNLQTNSSNIINNKLELINTGNILVTSSVGSNITILINNSGIINRIYYHKSNQVVLFGSLISGLTT